MRREVTRTFIEVQHGSPEYARTVKLRDAVLRRPLGLTFDTGELTRESDSFHLACRQGRRIVACVVLTPQGRHTVRLRQMAMAEGCQRRGIGRWLVTYAEDFLWRRGYRQVELHARESAVGFYERLGYRTAGERFVEVTVPHFRMTKRLAGRRE